MAFKLSKRAYGPALGDLTYTGLLYKPSRVCVHWHGDMMLLRHLVFSHRWCDLVPIFGRAEAELSMAFNMVIMKHLNVLKLRRCITHTCNMHK